MTWPRKRLHRYEQREAFPALPRSQVPQSIPQRARTLGVDKGLLEVPWEWHGRWDLRDLFSEKGRLPPKWHRNQQEGPKPETLDGGEGSGGVLGC